MPSRPSVLAGSALVVLGVAFALVPARGQQIHRHGFAGRQTALVRGDANVRVEEQEHDVSTQSFKSQPSSEHVKLTSDAGTGDAAFIHYFYETPPAPVSEVLAASVWVKATKAGVQLRARVVFPKEPDPNRPETPLTMLVVGETYDRARNWQKLSLGNVPDLVGKHLPVIQAKIGRAVNTTDAYVDRLVLNLYAGPGPVDVWVDDLDIGPVRPVPQAAEPGGGGVPAVPAVRPKAGDPAVPAARVRQIEHRDRQILVDGKPYFFRAIRHTGTPLHVLRAAGFETLWLPPDASQALVDEANREGWLLVPSVPSLAGDLDPKLVSKETTNRDLDTLTGFIRRFGAGDVLFWDFGGGRTAEQSQAVEVTAERFRALDPRRPRGADLWDGFQAYSVYLDVVGAHRWPLFTSLELDKYRDWLNQRRQLTAGRSTYWTWIQTHLPEWYVASLPSRPDGETFPDPVGPHPEQIRLLAYLGLASGCRGLGFWSDRFLADTHHGRDRLQQIALLNTELDMLSPVVLAAEERPIWLPTSHPNVKAALLRGRRGTLLLPIWMGPGSQHVPDQGAVANLKIAVPLITDGADPWLVTPANVECMRHLCKRVPSGIEITIPEFDLVAPIVFTDDLAPTGLVVWWQDHARKYGRLTARWALDLVAVEYEKVRATHLKLAEAGSEVRGADALLQETHRFYREAQKNFAAELYHQAYEDAMRAMRPLRMLMRDHWRQAVATLDVATASPYAVSFFSLPQHWEMFRQVQASQPAANVLPHGTFEMQGEVPPGGVRVDLLPGWSARFGTLDRVDVAAAIVSAEKLADERPPREYKKPPKTVLSPSRPFTPPDEGYTPPAPELGKSCLKLEVRAKVERDRDGKPLPMVPVLERTFLAVDSPPVRLPAGALVRVSGWVKVPLPVQGTADGVLFYDDAGGEPLAVRLTDTFEPPPPNQKNPAASPTTGVWKQFHLYRRVPATGQMSLTVALTGIGVAYFDDLRIEPLIPSGRDSGFTPPAGSPPGTQPGSPLPAPRPQPRPTPANVVSRPK